MLITVSEVSLTNDHFHTETINSVNHMMVRCAREVTRKHFVYSITALIVHNCFTNESSWTMVKHCNLFFLFFLHKVGLTYRNCLEVEKKGFQFQMLLFKHFATLENHNGLIKIVLPPNSHTVLMWRHWIKNPNKDRQMNKLKTHYLQLTKETSE